jgi:isoquinoline 1-oxidoreductase beta subunit
MSKPKKQSRRTFLKVTGVVAVGLVVGVVVARNRTRDRSTPFATADNAFEPDAFLQITPDNGINFFLPHNEMGQGIYTGLTTLIAEELDVEPEAIHIHHAKAHAAFASPAFGVQSTGGSTSMWARYLPLRQAGANARAQILAAAATELGAAVSELDTDNGAVVHGGQHYPYGGFATAAAELEPVEDAPLKPSSEFRYIGKDRPRLDAMLKSTGTAEFGIDVELPDMYRAVLVRGDVIGSKPISVNFDVVSEMPGVTDVVAIYNGVAVVADHYWQAKQAAAALKIEWELPEPLKDASSDVIRAEFGVALEAEEGSDVELVGAGEAALASAGQVVEATYWAPYLAHATMEPMNCVARIKDGQCDVWTGTQSPGTARGMAALHAGLPKRQVNIYSTFLGGGFGRRAAVDYVGEAVAIARAAGKTIQLVWSREDDMRHDYYRSASLVRMRGGLNADGTLETWTAKAVSPATMPYFLDDMLDAVLPAALPDDMVDWVSKRGYGVFGNWVTDPSSVEGLLSDYDVANKEMRHVARDPGLRLGFWRSVGHSFTGFFKESFVDELAYAASADAVEFRLRHAHSNPRLTAVIEKAAEVARWGGPAAEGRFQGFAAHTSYRSVVAQVAEVSVTGKQITVHRVYCAVECGIAVNPDIVRANVESAVIYGLSAALYGEISLKNGAVQQSNFHDYQVVRMAESPQIEVHIVPGDGTPTGIGEPGLPPLAAAVANAVFAATGQRLRELPFRLV